MNLDITQVLAVKQAVSKLPKEVNCCLSFHCDNTLETLEVTEALTLLTGDVEIKKAHPEDQMDGQNIVYFTF